ncbi:MAG: magnesium/cobalt efflux protein [Cardiobacteriales bacterium]|nr:MAG: magnesium/cobalt efflux protein [Cardiobacteriales bacterium]
MNDDPIEPKSNNWLHKISSLWSDHSAPNDYTRAFTDLLYQARQAKALNEDTAAMIESLLHISETQVRDIMIPRGQMIVIEDDWSMDKVLSVILESGHSRYPVVDEAHEKLHGILLSKDLLPLLMESKKNLGFLEQIRPATIVPESKPLDAILREFQVNRNHMALVIDEYGNLSGLITIEDVIEEIVGEIDDEHDKIADTKILANDDGSYQIKALADIKEVNEALGIELSGEDADTIGGYILMKMERMPAVGETITFAGWHVTITKANQRRIISILMRPE